MYEVIASFSDNVDGGVYYIGNTYPKDGVNPSQDRIAYLMSNKNKIGVPLIRKIGGTPSIEVNEEPEKPKRNRRKS